MDDGTSTAQSLAQHLAGVTIDGLTADQVTARLIDAVAEWGSAQGWRVYRRAPSVFPLPAPLNGHSVLDVAFARPDGGQPVVAELDRLDRQRTVDKLLAEASAGRLALWVRWGAGPFTPPPLPVHLVTKPAVRRKGRWHTETVLPAPRHSGVVALEADQLPLEGE